MPPLATSQSDDPLALLTRGCVTVVRPEDLAEKLARSRRNGKPLIVKAGFDPSSPNIHIGHTVLMRKMRAFQDLGHEVHYVVGDFTAMIGDPSGKSKTRPQLTPDEVSANARTYQEQAFKVLDPSRTVVEYNSRWLSPLSATDIVLLSAKTTVARMIEREDFKSRLEKGAPISVHEMLYPLYQAYDSVALRADVELGGTDQTWNLLLGRDIMREYGQEPQVVMTVPLLEGLDGVQKMSKSLGNTVDVLDAPADMFGKLMSVSDDLMWRYLSLLCDIPSEELAREREAAASGRRHPMEVKKEMASRVVVSFHGAPAAAEARASFEQQFQKRMTPDAVEESRIARASLPIDIVTLITDLGLAPSKSEARRLVLQGAVDLDGARVKDPKHRIAADAPSALLLRVGKRAYRRCLVID